MTDKFRVALSGDFRKADGSPTYPDFDLAPLHAAQGVEVVFLKSANPLRADQLEDIDALILLAHRFTAESVPASVMKPPPVTVAAPLELSMRTKRMKTSCQSVRCVLVA